MSWHRVWYWRIERRWYAVRGWWRIVIRKKSPIWKDAVTCDLPYCEMCGGMKWRIVEELKGEKK